MPAALVIEHADLSIERISHKGSPTTSTMEEVRVASYENDDGELTLSINFSQTVGDDIHGVLSIDGVDDIEALKRYIEMVIDQHKESNIKF